LAAIGRPIGLAMSVRATFVVEGENGPEVSRAGPNTTTADAQQASNAAVGTSIQLGALRRCGGSMGMAPDEA
jgi:hypothetical protein